MSEFLPQIYVAISLPALAFLVFAMPPFQNPDEKGHFMRAYQVAHGAILAEVRGNESGGAIDTGLRDLWLLTEPIWGNSSRKYPEDLRREAQSFDWTGTTTYQQFGNQAFYGPLLYLPQAGAIRLGSLLGLSVADTMVLARLFLGFTVIAIGATVLSRLLHGRHMAFLFLTLPMTLAMTASTSQDGLQIVLGMAVIALALNWAVSDTPPRVAAALGFVAAIVVLSWGRVIMAALALLLAGAAFGRVPLPVPRGRWPRRLALGAVCAGLVVAVSAVQAATMAPAMRAHVSAQLSYLLGDPGAVFGIAYVTLRNMLPTYAQEFIACLGWRELYMSNAFYAAGLGVLALGVIRDAGDAPRLALRERVIALAAMLLYGAWVFGGAYLQASKVGAQAVFGVQGRYFLPIALLSAFLLPRISLSEPAKKILTVIVSVAPVPLLILAGNAVLVRYYEPGLALCTIEQISPWNMVCR